MENHLTKFGDHQENQAKQAYLEEKMEDQQHKLNLMEQRRSQLNKLQRNAGFMEDWQLQGIQNWKENQKRKKERELNTLQFQQDKEEKQRKRQQKKLDLAKKETEDGIESFERKLQIAKFQVKEDTFKVKDEDMENIKSKIETQDIERICRDKRRKKMIVDQIKKQEELEFKRREEKNINILSKRAKQEKQLAYEE